MTEPVREPTVSPSSYDTHELCARKFGFRLRDKYAQNLGAFRGDSVHKILELWGTKRKPPADSEAAIINELRARYLTDLTDRPYPTTPEEYAGRIVALAHKMIGFLPDPPWTRVEQWVRVKINGVTWVGKVDLQHGGNIVHDHKVTSSPPPPKNGPKDPTVHFSKTPADLLTDTQANFYAYAKFFHEAPDTVLLNWLYGQPGKSPRVWLVEQEVTPEHVAAEMARRTDRAKEIVRLLVLRPDPNTLEPNPKACDQLGGCPYQPVCELSPAQMMSAYFHD